MGTIQEQCEECFNCSNMDEIEFKKEHIDNLKLGLSPKVNTNISESNKIYEKDLAFIENSIDKAVLIITNPKLYEKMLKGEKLHYILEPLTSFSNNHLFGIIKNLLIKIEEFKNSEKNSVYLNFEKVYKDLINKGIIENIIRYDLGFFTKVKFNLIYVIEIITEIYHYFKYHNSNGMSPYNIHYWEFVKNTVVYINEKIKDMQKTLEETYNFIYENKIKNINNSVNIHITTNNFNVQMDQ